MSLLITAKILLTTSPMHLMKRYESFFPDVMDGKSGSTAAYWATYVYLINRVYQELQRAFQNQHIRLAKLFFTNNAILKISILCLSCFLNITCLKCSKHACWSGLAELMCLPLSSKASEGQLGCNFPTYQWPV